MSELGECSNPHAAQDRTHADHLPLHHPLEQHADRFVAQLFAPDFDQLSREMFETDVVREDRSTLSSLGSSTTTYRGGAKNERLVIVVAGPTGRIARLVTFDIDDLSAAQSELDRIAENNARSRTN